MASIAKNTSYMMVASVLQKIISLTYFTIIARTIGAEQTGTYTAALAMTTIFVVFVDLGFTNVFIREAAKVREKMQQLFSNVLFAKLIFGLVSYAAMAIVLKLSGFEIEFQYLVYASGITMLFDSIHLTLYGALRAAGQLKYEAVGMVGSQLLTMIMGIVFLQLGWPLIFLIFAFTVAAGVNMLYAAIMVRRVCDLRLLPRLHGPTLRMVAIIAVPFALAAIFGRIYSYVDVLLLKKLAGDLQVGFYSTPSKIVFAFQFIPLALVASLYPRFSEYFVQNRERLARLFEQSLLFLFIIAVPIAVGIYLLADDIIIFVFTAEYSASILPLKILIFSLIFSFVSFPIGAFLNACSRQVTQTVITGVVLVLNVALNVVLIPRLGAVGAAYAAFAANVLLAVLGYLIVPRITRINHWFIAKKLLLILAAVVIMGIIVLWVASFSHFLIAIVAGAFSYAILLFITRVLTRAQVFELVALLKK